jgi:hypothetical protein
LEFVVCLLAFAVLALLLAQPAAAGELQWQRGKTPSARKAKQAETPASRKTRVHRDGAVRTVQYEVASGPSFGDDYDDGQLRSLVVEPDEMADDDRGQVRTAQQLEFRPAEPDTRYQEELGTPFGEDPSATSPGFEEELDQDMGEDLFPLDEPGVEAPPTFNDDEYALPPADAPPSPARQPMREPLREPRRPTASPPRTFEPRQPQRPSGRNSFDAEPLPRGTTSFPTRSDDSSGGYFDNDRDAAAAEVSCSEELAKLKASTLQDVELTIAVNGVAGEDFPVECSIDDGTWYAGRCWAHTVYTWKASALCHKPLYFEDEALERYGHSWGPCCDPLVSGAHFFSKLAVLPYCMGIAPPCECQYALGHYRPGSCAPYMCDPIPIMSRATLLQAGAVVGTAALLP